jgi:RNA polymerase sigma factor (TIGR02999 family)
MKPLGAGNPEPGGQPPQGHVTVLLQRAGKGEQAATDELFPLVYDELRRLAGGMLAAERASHTLQPTALVHEAYMRLVGPSNQGWEGRAHFFGAAARAIRRILVDHARARGRLKRGGDRQRVSLEEHEAPHSSPLDLLALDDALEQLANIDPRMARLVELRFFAGLTVNEAAEAIGVSPATAAREWELARVWLHARLSEEDTRDA